MTLPDRPVTGKWFEELTVGTVIHHAIRRTVTEADNGLQLYCIVTNGSGGTTQSNTATVTVVRVGLDDQTSAHDRSTGALVVAAEGAVTEVPDYEFSGRTIYRRDKTLNPR